MQIKIVPDDLRTFLTILGQTHRWNQNKICRGGCL